MRRTIAALALTVLCTMTVTSCDKAKELVSSAGCSGLDAAAKSLPASDNISESTINGLASVAKTVQSVMSKLPTDKLPANVKGTVDKAIADAEAAAEKVKTDPEAAKKTAAQAITSLNTAITQTKSALSC